MDLTNLEACVIEILHRDDVDSFEMAKVAKQINADEVYTLYRPLIENHLIQCDKTFNNDDVFQIALKMFQSLKEY